MDVGEKRVKATDKRSLKKGSITVCEIIPSESMPQILSSSTSIPRIISYRAEWKVVPHLKIGRIQKTLIVNLTEMAIH